MTINVLPDHVMRTVFFSTGTRLRMAATSLIDAELAWVPRARRPRPRLTCGNLRASWEA
jgi:hypothetical protein